MNGTDVTAGTGTGTGVVVVLAAAPFAANDADAVELCTRVEFADERPRPSDASGRSGCWPR